jgi:nucleoside-diphosphate-sugar epimerase
LSTLRALLARGDSVTVFEADRRKTKRAAARFRASLGSRYGAAPSEGAKRCRFFFGDIRDEAALAAALSLKPPDRPGDDKRGIVDAVCHLAAVLPPAADRVPGLADSVNAGGTAALTRACLALAAAKAVAPPRVILASSIAVYGDRLASPIIRSGDDPAPDDAYGRSKLECERILRNSGLPWTIFRLTYIVSPGWIQPDPMLFDMPVSTRLEICHTEDAGRAFAAAAHCPESEGKILDIGGGASCRTVFRSYLDRMFRNFGLGSSAFLPDEAFARGNFHCGWYGDSDEVEAMLGFRTKNLEDYYSEVHWATRRIRFFAIAFAPIVRGRLRASSPYLRPAVCAATPRVASPLPASAAIPP